MEEQLQQIIDYKRTEIKKAKEAVELQMLLALGGERLNRKTRSLREALSVSPHGFIADFKRKSPPTEGFRSNVSITEMVADYEKREVAACSIPTDYALFGGSWSDLKKARQQTHLPLLHNDLFLDTYQLFQSKIMGADAIVLRASALTPDECQILTDTAHCLQLEVLLLIEEESTLSYINNNIDMVGLSGHPTELLQNETFSSLFTACPLQDSTPLLICMCETIHPLELSSLRAMGFQGVLTNPTKDSNQII